MKLRIEQETKIVKRYFAKCEKCGIEKEFRPAIDSQSDECARNYTFNNEHCEECKRKEKEKVSKEKYKFFIGATVSDIEVDSDYIYAIYLNVGKEKIKVIIDDALQEDLKEMVENNEI